MRTESRNVRVALGLEDLVKAALVDAVVRLRSLLSLQLSPCVDRRGFSRNLKIDTAEFLHSNACSVA